MRTRLIKGASGLGLAVALFYGWSLTTAPASATVVTPTVSATTTPAWYFLGSCDEDAPDPTLTVPCVWEDDGIYWVMDGKGGSIDKPQCTTEDSDHCVWDSATQGNASESVDSPKRYIVAP
jgi:hypothetical protein